MAIQARSLDELRSYADDIRQTILSGCLKNGGHLGASLGAVEIAIALHSVFDSPREPLVWDVGHQAYAHKIITGRGAGFEHLRQYGGISGFLSRAESEHDVFGAGHSSTSLSAALGIAWTKRDTKDWTVAVIGDGGLTAGLAFEALNNIRANPIGPLLIVLNDNQMSISPNVGAMPTILSGANAKEYFSLFGLDYVGPVDGHNLEELIGTLRGIRESGTPVPVVLHALTQKGKGYAPAEENPGVYHGIGPVKKVQEKIPAAAPSPKQKTFSEAFGEATCRLAAENPSVLAITAAMPDGTGLDGFFHRFPKRAFDVGIAEPHAVTFAGGLATQGMRPVVAIYSTFLQRALDEIIHDIALQKLPVVFVVDRAGVVGADGPTHHGAFDLVYLSMIPGMTVFAPETLSDVETCLREALNLSGPAAIRFPRGGGQDECVARRTADGVRWHRESADPHVIVASVGATYQRVERAMKSLDTRGVGGRISWAGISTVKPIPPSLEGLLRARPGVKILSVEDGSLIGGFGERIRAHESIGYGDHFIPHGAPAKLEEVEKLSSADIEKKILKLLEPS